MSSWCELVFATSTMEKWLKNPAIKKRQIGLQLAMEAARLSDDVPLSDGEVQRFKALLERRAPSTYARLFK